MSVFFRFHILIYYFFFLLIFNETAIVSQNATITDNVCLSIYSLFSDNWQTQHQNRTLKITFYCVNVQQQQQKTTDSSTLHMALAIGICIFENTAKKKLPKMNAKKLNRSLKQLS